MELAWLFCLYCMNWWFSEMFWVTELHYLRLTSFTWTKTLKHWRFFCLKKYILQSYLRNANIKSTNRKWTTRWMIVVEKRMVVHWMIYHIIESHLLGIQGFYLLNRKVLQLQSFTAWNVTVEHRCGIPVCLDSAFTMTMAESTSRSQLPESIKLLESSTRAKQP